MSVRPKILLFFSLFVFSFTFIPLFAQTEDLSSLLNQAAAVQSALSSKGVTTSYVFTKFLTLGTKNTDVLNLQKLLNTDPDTQVAKTSYGSPGEETNYFGPATRKALINFQKKYKIDPVGQVGPITRAKLTLIASNNLKLPTQSLNTQSLSTISTAGCLVGHLFNIKTGQRCSTLSNSLIIPETTSSALPVTANEVATLSNQVSTNSANTNTNSNNINSNTNPLQPSVITSGSGECFDNIDNDSDGKKDFEDFGCFGPNGQETSSNYGYTIFTPSSDTRIIYVSSSQGSDTNNGLSSATPVKTLAKGATLMRSRNGYPDWLLIKRGDVFDEGEGLNNWKVSGRSKSEPMLISTYGASPVRPVIKTNYNGIYAQDPANPASNVAIVGLDFYNSRNDPHSPDYDGKSHSNYGISWFNGVNLLIEDCVARFFLINMQVTNNSGVVDGVTLRRNIIVDSYATSAHSQGLFLSGINGITLEGNVFDHNGWNASLPAIAEQTIFNHNVYMTASGNTNVFVRDNIFANASSHGLQARSGGTITGNVFLNNPINLLVGRPALPVIGSASTISGNYFSGSRDINGMSRGAALETNAPAAGSSVTNNIFSGVDTIGTSYAMQLAGGSNIGGSELGYNMTIENNIIYGWSNGFYYNPNLIPGGNDQNAIRRLTVRNNSFQKIPKQLVVHPNPYDATYEPWSGNNYYSLNDQTKWFTTGSRYISTPFSDWKANFDPTGVAAQVSYNDPTRTVKTYNASLGGQASVDAFLAEARKQSRFNWRSNYTANAVNSYIRAGFNVTGSTPIQTTASVPTTPTTPTTPVTPTTPTTPVTPVTPTTPTTPPTIPAPTNNPNGLVVHYTFDDGTASDSSGSGNNGTLIGNPVAVAGKLGQALNFPGSGNYVKAGPLSLSGATDFSASLWVNTSASTQYDLICNEGSNANGGFCIEVYSPTLIRLTLNNQTTRVISQYFTIPNIANRWAHIVLVVEHVSGGVKMYVDGAAVSGSANGTLSDSIGSTKGFQIGAGTWNGIGTNGSFDDVRVYSRALTGSEISALYSSTVSNFPINLESNLAAVGDTTESLIEQFKDILNKIGSFFGN